MLNKAFTLSMAAVLLLLPGCAMQPVNIKMAAVGPASNTAFLNVIDNRLVKDLEIVYTTFNSSNGTVPFALEPDVPAALKQQIVLTKKLNAPMLISLERAQFRNRVGFGTADNMSCALESNVTTDGQPAKVVRTVLTDVPNDSPRVIIGANILIKECLTRHGQDIASYINLP